MMSACLGCGKEYQVACGSHGVVCSLKCWGKIRTSVVPGRPHPTGKGGKRSDLGNVYFRSSWEANWARYLNWLMSIGEVLRWEFEPDTFEFPVRRGSRFYTPDFKVFNKDGSVEYHEVKGWMDKRSATKLKRMAKYHPAIKLVLIDAKQYRAVARKIASLIPAWERNPKKGF